MRGGENKDSFSSSQTMKCWKTMSQICASNKVQFLGLCGASQKFFEKVNANSVRKPESYLPVSVICVDLNPCKHASDLICLQKLRKTVRIIAFNVFGAHANLLEDDSLIEMSTTHSIDPALLLIKWGALQADGLMVPSLSSGGLREAPS